MLLETADATCVLALAELGFESLQWAETHPDDTDETPPATNKDYMVQAKAINRFKECLLRGHNDGIEMPVTEGILHRDFAPLPDTIRSARAGLDAGASSVVVASFSGPSVSYHHKTRWERLGFRAVSRLNHSKRCYDVHVSRN